MLQKLQTYTPYISMQPDDVDLNISNNEFYEQWKMLMFKIRFTPSGFKEKGIRKFEFEPKLCYFLEKSFGAA